MEGKKGGKEKEKLVIGSKETRQGDFLYVSFVSSSSFVLLEYVSFEKLVIINIWKREHLDDILIHGCKNEMPSKNHSSYLLYAPQDL